MPSLGHLSPQEYGAERERRPKLSLKKVVDQTLGLDSIDYFDDCLVEADEMPNRDCQRTRARIEMTLMMPTVDVVFVRDPSRLNTFFNFGSHEINEDVQVTQEWLREQSICVQMAFDRFGERPALRRERWDNDVMKLIACDAGLHYRICSKRQQKFTVGKFYAHYRSPISCAPA